MSDDDFGKVWLKTSEIMPIAKRKYWLSDGKDVALGVWNIERMQWKFLYHYNVFKPTYMLPVKLPPLPEE